MKRLAKLIDLINNSFGGNQAAFARAIKRSPAQVNQWKTGQRELGDAGARIIELALNLEQGYFDETNKARQTTAVYKTKVAKFKKRPDPHIEKVVAMMEATDETGRMMALAAVKVALSSYIPNKAKSVS